MELFATTQEFVNLSSPPNNVTYTTHSTPSKRTGGLQVLKEIKNHQIIDREVGGTQSVLYCHENIDFDELSTSSGESTSPQSIKLQFLDDSFDFNFSDTLAALNDSFDLEKLLDSIPNCLPSEQEAIKSVVEILDAEDPKEKEKIKMKEVEIPSEVSVIPSSIKNFETKVLRISWLTNVSKVGWSFIRPLPRAISRQKKIILEPISGITSNPYNLFLEITTEHASHNTPCLNVAPQLSVQLPDGNAAHSFKLSLTQGATKRTTIPQEILFSCQYTRPESKAPRIVHAVRIFDEYRREVLYWPVEVFNPKWESMTKSQDKPEPHNSYSLAVFSETDNSWSIQNYQYPEFQA